jgi:hypothetical protein
MDSKGITKRTQAFSPEIRITDCRRKQVLAANPASDEPGASESETPGRRFGRAPLSSALELLPKLPPICVPPLLCYTLPFDTNSAKYSNERLNVFSASGGKQHPGSSRFLMW